MSTESPFQIAISDYQLALLHQKLTLTNLPNELEDAGWSYGSPLADIQRLVNRWKDGYDWRKYEAQLNSELPQYTRDIDVDGFGTLNIHYVHKRSDEKNAIPLLFVHGWPGSFIEIRKILPLLVEASPDYPSFHVVALSLPGFGFSAAPTKKGFGSPQYAEVGNKLMLALGYEEYVTQGGDWGSLITRRIASIYGTKHSKAWHTNMPYDRDKAGLARTQWFVNLGSGYTALQSTQPQTLGYALADSPVGLLAWIYEKLVQWTDEYKWDDDEVLTWVSIYYFSRAGPAASLRIYYEATKDWTAQDSISIPQGHSYFPKEIFVLPRNWYKAPNLVFESDHEHGGHFAAHEKPEELVGDLRKMFGKGGPAFGVVKRQTGYA